MEIRNIQDLYFETVEEKIEEIKKRIGKEQGNLDRYVLKHEALIDGRRAELVMLGALLEHLPRRQPEIFPIKDEEMIPAE